MKLRYTLTGFILLTFSVTFAQKKTFRQDSLRIEKLNQAGYEIRLTDPAKAVKYGQQALLLANKADYKNGIAEACRVIGIGYYYIGKSDSAVTKYLYSLSVFKEINNIAGQARVYNNIGNLYREVDYNTGLNYFNKSLKLAIKANLPDLIAGTYLNIGIIYHRKKLYHQALSNFDKSLQIFKKLNNPIGIIHSLQNKGVVYYALKQIPGAEKLLSEANQKAKENDLNNAVASINLTLTDVYIARNEFKKAEQVRNEGVLYSRLARNKKLEHDYLLTSYELENKRKNYKLALFYLREVYRSDSIAFDNVESDKIRLLEAQFKFLQKEKESQLIIERQKTNRILFFASIAVSILAFIVVFILIFHVKKKAKTNKLLKILNEEISLQKEHLNKVNHNLEEIISERTRDLKIKNRKLAEYSSHLSHQIRGPVATMKGLIILDKQSLIDNREFIKEISKCVNQIDDRIMNINDVLNDLSEPGLIPKAVNKERKS